MTQPRVSGVNGTAVGLLAVGGIITYAAIKGFGIGELTRTLIAGKDPVKLSQIWPIDTQVDVATTGDGSISGTSFASNSAIANAAMKYNGQVPYVFGGGSPRGWDCSGFVNYVLGHDLHIQIPWGNPFDGPQHGPIVGAYLVWNKAKTVPISQIQAGDIVVYGISHIGIAVGPDAVINAYDTGHVTEVDTLYGTASYRPITIRRYTG